MSKKEIIKRLLNISEEEILEVLNGKDDISVFAVYIAAINFHDYGYHIFLEHNFTIKTTLPKDRVVNNCNCLYDVLMRNPFRMREDGDLFGFIKNSIILNRNLKDGELL